jgi:FkbM family methyltransferase
MELSYAQNMEDMHLAAIFAGQDAGFYIDIGGGHPVADNVSFKACLAGWRGVVVEPQETLHRLYAGVRPRDVALRVLVGRTEGESDFHIVDRLHGFSTTVRANAEGAAGFGAGYSTATLPMTTLAALCEAHAPGAIDWLKIDVEGAEADVIAGNDWTRHRPRIILVEAVAPGSMEPSHAEWEPMLLSAGYEFVFFDGLNRFYLAVEAQDLRERIPAVFKDWGEARHLYDHGRALEVAGHPDHALASALMGLKMADLPLLPQDMLLGFLTKNIDEAELSRVAGASAVARHASLWLGSEPHAEDLSALSGLPLREALAALAASQAFRAALGRIAAGYDGGFVMDG